MERIEHPTPARRRVLARLWLLAFCGMLVAANLAFVFTRVDRLASPTLVDATGDLGNFFAFNGLVLLTATMLMGSRNPWIERVFGLDKLMLWHRTLAILAVLFFCGHAGFRSWSISMQRGRTYDLSLLYSMDLAEWDVVMGRVALLLMIAAATLALLGTRRQILRYKRWNRPHLLLYAAALLGFSHGMLHGDDLPTAPFFWQWALLLGLVLADAVRRLRYVLRRDPERVWSVAAVREETRDTTTLVLRHDGGCPHFAARRPGQFAVVRLPRVPHLDEPHPFTLSGATAADPNRLELTVKVAGDFTEEFVRLTPGTEVLCEGPYGVFCADVLEQERLVFIAGGVGATPFLSVLRTFAVTGQAVPALFIWSNKRRRDVFAAEELADLCTRLPLRVVHCLSRETPESVAALPQTPGVTYQSGRVDAERLASLCDGCESFYLCGPELFQESVLRCLDERLHVPRRRVSRELFFW